MEGISFFCLHVQTPTSSLWGVQSVILKDVWGKGGRSDWINIPEPLLFKIIIGYSGSPTGRKIKLSAGGDEHSVSLTDGQTDERNGRQVQNTLKLWPQGWYTAVLHFESRKWKKKKRSNTCRSTYCGQRKVCSSLGPAPGGCYERVTHFGSDHSSACVWFPQTDLHVE